MSSPEVLGAPCELRRGGMSDVPRLVVISDDSFDPGFGEAWTAPQLASALNQTNHWVELAICEDQPQGFALARRIGEEAELLLIAVRHAYRGRGLATALLRQVAAAACESGALSLFLEVRDGNSAAIRLYDRLGFVPIGRRKDYYASACGARVDGTTMQRPLFPA